VVQGLKVIKDLKDLREDLKVIRDLKELKD
jgi:3-keto-L-gulonate-6-phosphate decarboxylase